MIVLTAATESELELAFAAANQKGVGGLSIDLDPFFGVTRSKIIALAAAYGVPTIWYFAYIVREGGLMSYAPDLADGYRQAGLYAAAPAGTSAAIVERLSLELRAAVMSEEVRERMLNEGAEPVVSTPAEYAAEIDSEERKWSALVKSLNLKME